MTEKELDAKDVVQLGNEIAEKLCEEVIELCMNGEYRDVHEWLSEYFEAECTKLFHDNGIDALRDYYVSTVLYGELEEEEDEDES